MSTMKEQATHEAPPATHHPWTACGGVQGAIGRRAGQGATLPLCMGCVKGSIGRRAGQGASLLLRGGGGA